MVKIERFSSKRIGNRSNDTSDWTTASGIDVLCLLEAYAPISQSGKRKQVRLGIVEVDCDCAISPKEYLTWARKFTYLNRVQEIITRYPTRLKENILLTRKPKVDPKHAVPADNVHNFLVPIRILASLKSELIQWTSINEFTECVDGAETDIILVAFIRTDSVGFSLWVNRSIL